MSPVRKPGWQTGCPLQASGNCLRRLSQKPISMKRHTDIPQKALLLPRTTVLLIVFLAGIAAAQDSPHGPHVLRCTDCHGGESWTQLNPILKFDHEATAFPLRGQHRDATCRLCHTTLRFAGTTSDCFGCHRRDFESATAVNHKAAGFSTRCTECHDESASSWLSSFDHDKTNFPTRGIHASLPCKTCHTQNRFQGTPVECVSCHLREYTATTNPRHSAAKFNTDCATCHRALTWQPATLFPHDQWFPISAGSHHSPGTWNSCSDCHANQANYGAFECINCHQHDKTSTDNTHSRRSGYQYLSSACYRCHAQA